MKKFIKGVLDRFKEPSSWAAITAGLVAIGINMDAELLQHIVNGLAALAGAIAFFLREKPAA